MVSTVSIIFSLRGIIVSLFAVAVLSQQCGNGALCKRNSVDCPQVIFLEHPGNITVFVGDTNVEIKCRLSNERIVVRWIHSLRDVELSTFGGNTFTSPEKLERFTEKTNITFSGGFYANLIILTVSPRHHGKYRCGLLSCEEFSYSGTVTVKGPVEMQFNPNTNSLNATAGQNKTVEFIVFGAPEPSLHLFKRKDDGTYQEITDNKFTLTMTVFSVKSIQLEDAGSYRIWGNNTYGNSSLDFQIIVTGVSPPNITLSETRITPPSYRTQINVTCSVPQTAYEPNLELYWAFSSNNSRVSISDSIKDLTNPSNISTYLFITRFSEIHNGNYTCHAMNSNERRSSQVMLIGPPAKMNPPTVRGISNEPNQVRIEWTKPDSYGAALTKYIIIYSISTQGNIEKNMTVEYGKSETDITGICIAGTWSFHIAAINEYGNTGDFSEPRLFNIETNCPTTPPPPPPPNTTTTTSDKSETFNTILHSNTQTSPVTSTTTTTTTPPTAPNSLPIVAGAAAGVVVLVVAVCFLVFAVLCWVAVTKRASKRRAMTQWHHPEDQIDNSLSILSLPEKSPEPPLDIMGIPSPLPATAGYGPIYIDPCYEFPRENLELTDILYDGSYTVIYKAKAVGIKENKAIEVAVKSIKEDFLEMDDYVSTLVMEMEQLSQLDPHPNIVGLLRVCTVGRPVYMVIEYMCHGDLLGFLRATRGHSDMYTVFPGTKNIPTNVKLTSRDLLNIISQVAKGMLFLSEQKIPHGALCARNVLVGTSMEVKVFNIGIHNLDNEETYESLIRWMAPEVFMDGLRTTYSDIWSFGILMWEVVTVGGTPYKDFDLNDLHTHLMSGIRLKRPDHCTQPLYDVMMSCWENIPQHRPLFSEIIEQLNNLNHLKMSFLDLKNYNEMQYSQFDISETQLTSVL